MTTTAPAPRSRARPCVLGAIGIAVCQAGCAEPRVPPAYGAGEPSKLAEESKGASIELELVLERRPLPHGAGELSIGVSACAGGRRWPVLALVRAGRASSVATIDRPLGCTVAAQGGAFDAPLPLESGEDSAAASFQVSVLPWGSQRTAVLVDHRLVYEHVSHSIHLFVVEDAGLDLVWSSVPVASVHHAVVLEGGRLVHRHQVDLAGTGEPDQYRLTALDLDPAGKLIESELGPRALLRPEHTTLEAARSEEANLEKRCPALTFLVLDVSPSPDVRRFAVAVPLESAEAAGNVQQRLAECSTDAFRLITPSS